MFQFRQFTIRQDQCAQKVSEVACVFGAWIRLQDSCSRVLDIGSGSGLLTLMLAQRYPVRIDAIELETATAIQCKENCMASPFADRIQVIHGDVLHYQAANQYDAIICNPPFFEKQLQTPDPLRKTAQHATRLTLNALLDKASMLLSDTGKLFLLFPFDRHQALLTAAAKAGFYLSCQCHLRHSIQHPCKVCMYVFSKQKEVFSDGDICMHEADASYTTEMKNLLEMYYLERAFI